MSGLTKPQRYWLATAIFAGFVEEGYLMGRSQRNRPLNKLVALGLLKSVWTHPDGGFMYGYIPALSLDRYRELCS